MCNMTGVPIPRYAVAFNVLVNRYLGKANDRILKK